MKVNAVQTRAQLREESNTEKENINKNDMEKTNEELNS